jgi:uncharacterized protein (DUF2141 family)
MADGPTVHSRCANGRPPRSANNRRSLAQSRWRRTRRPPKSGSSKPPGFTHVTRMTAMNIVPLAALLAALAAPAPAQSAPAAPARLALTFDVGAGTGSVMVALFDSEAAYAGGAPVRRARLDVAAGERTATFELPAGTYAAKAFHDVDGNGQLTVNPFGLPVEPFAFSNNARGNMGPAPWDRARFTVSGDTALTIALR